MSLDRQLDEKNGVFQDLTQLQASEPTVGNLISSNISGVVTWYSVGDADLGSGLLLANGNYANPTVADPQTAINTADISNLKGLNSNNQTGTAYTLVLSDADAGEVWMNNASANVLTIPTNSAVAFPVETVILIMMEGAGVTSIAADVGVTLNGVVAGSGDLTQYNGVALKKRATDTWIATPLTVA